jgi:hypothetical protein
MPPQAAAEEQLAQFVELAAEPLAELLPAAAALLEEPLLLVPQPAASKIDPTAAAVATIAFDARKVKPSPCPPPVVHRGQEIASWLDKSQSWPSGLNGR